MPALVADALKGIAEAHHAAYPEGATEARLVTQLGALIPRVMHPGSWAEAARHAGAEPLGTGRSRVYDPSTLRQLAALGEQEASLRVRLAALQQEPPTRPIQRAIAATKRKVAKVCAQQARTRAEATLKHARPEGGAERLGKWLHLLTHNALALALYTSTDPVIRTMSPAKVFDLLLSQPALARIAPAHLTLWVEPVGSATDRRLQAGLIVVFNALRLQSRGSLITLRLRETQPEEGA